MIMLPQIQYDKALLGKMKSNYFNAKALYETIKANAEEIRISSAFALMVSYNAFALK